MSITVNRGDIFGFLGPNGAGKSTTIRTLLDFIRPSGGSASIFGLDCHNDSVAIRRRIGYIPGDFGLYGHMTGWKLLEYIGKVRGGYDFPHVRELAKRLDIRLDRKMKEYSRGMRRKVAIIQAFMNSPDLIIMDEPTTGLDPLIQQTFMDLIREEAGRGATIFMSSHVLSEAEKVCNRVAIIKDGGIVAEEQVEALRQKSGKALEVRFAQPLTREIFYLPGISNVTRNNGTYRMNVTGNLEELLREISAYKLADISIHQMTLEDIFMHYYEEAK